MTCDCHQQNADTETERRTLRIALVLNATMFVVGMAAGLWAQSTGLMADALDMLTDAAAYVLSLMAVTRGARFKRCSARWTSATLVFLSVGIFVDVVRRFMFGSEPLGGAMITFSLLSLAVNVTVLGMLSKYREGEVHLRASWICTRADVIANFGVLASGLVVLATGWRYADLLAGVGIATYVAKEALEIWRRTSYSEEGRRSLQADH